MTCEIIKDLIPMYVDKTASEDASAAVKEHIKNCPDCRRFCKVCKSYEEKSAFACKEKEINASGVDEKFANFSKRLKKRKIIHIIITSCVIVGMLTYIIIDIVNTAKRRESSSVEV